MSRLTRCLRMLDIDPVTVEVTSVLSELDATLAVLRLQAQDTGWIREERAALRSAERALTCPYTRHCADHCGPDAATEHDAQRRHVWQAHDRLDYAQLVGRADGHEVAARARLRACRQLLAIAHGLHSSWVADILALVALQRRWAVEDLQEEVGYRRSLRDHPGQPTPAPTPRQLPPTPVDAADEPLAEWERELLGI